MKNNIIYKLKQLLVDEQYPFTLFPYLFFSSPQHAGRTNILIDRLIS